MSTSLDVSVIIPTHDRADSVVRTLHALEHQTLDPDRFEVIVVADGCSDNTTEILRTSAWPFTLTVLEQPAGGQGRARNLGAKHAGAPLLVFLDDDIEPVPGLLAVYRRAHERCPGSLLLGHTPPVLQDATSLFHIGLRNWWQDHILALKRRGHRFTYRDMHSGNFAIATGLFARCGGFDADFSGRSGEDYELGVRLLKLSVPFAFVTDAVGRHHDASDLVRSLSRVRMEGRADALIGRKHPELRRALPLATLASRHRLLRSLATLAFTRPGMGDRIAGGLQRILGPLERLKLRRNWHRVHGAVRAYWYFRGVAEELEVRALDGLRLFLEEARSPRLPLPDLHLDDGLEESRRALDALRPAGVRLCLAGVPIKVVATLPGAEPLRGDHLPGLLADGTTTERFLIGLALGRTRDLPGWRHFLATGTERASPGLDRA